MLTAMRYKLLSPVAHAAGKFLSTNRSPVFEERRDEVVGGGAACVNNEKRQQK